MRMKRDDEVEDFGTRRTVHDHPHITRGEPGNTSNALDRYATPIRIGHGIPQRNPGGEAATLVGALPVR
ncbi:hypothetical protein [Embleya sp. NPDC059237]|uniref:hypothetical protein n=1 Tax=Embleya sp. NPDC059237 TaxID=3346784 RepID=UPI0036A52EDF